jgi:ribosomal protein S18 acetylase RimI-like enzyme
MIEIIRLPPERWMESRDLRLAALKEEPSAYGGSYEEEMNFSEDEWKRRLPNALYALSDDKPVGTVTYIVSERAKLKHIAQIFGVYVDPDYRGRGIGRKMLETALDLISKNKDIVKIRLTVNRQRDPAVALYKSLGFLVVGELEKELRVDGVFYDELMMEKML